MKIAIISLSDSSCMAVYDDSAPNQSRFGGPWGWMDHTIHMQVPGGLLDESGNVLPIAIKGIQDDQGNWSIVGNV